MPQDLTSIIRQLFSLDPHQAPATLPSQTIGGGAAPAAPVAGAPTGAAPAAPTAADPRVLATLGQNSTPRSPTGPFGIPAGNVPDVRGKSKGSAFATGLGAGMKNAQDANIAQNNLDAQRAKTNLDTMKMLFEQQQKGAELALNTKKANDLGGYYKSMGDYYANGGSKSDSDPANNEYKRQMALTSAAQRIGLYDQEMRKDLQSPVDSIRSRAQTRYDQLKQQYDAEAALINKQFGGVGKATAPAAQAPTVTPPAQPSAPGGTPAPAGGTPTQSTPNAPAPGAPTPPVATPQTWKVIKKQNPDGTFTRQLFDPVSGATKPMEESGNTPGTNPAPGSDDDSGE